MTRICPECGSGAYEKKGRITSCLECGYIFEQVAPFKRTIISHPVVTTGLTPRIVKKQITKMPATIPVLTPRPESRRHMPLGRPRTGEWKKCVDCGKQIYMRKYRIEKKPEAEHRCRKCASKHIAKAPRRKDTREPRSMENITRVAELKPAIIDAVSKGISIRQAAREFGLAIHTVSNIVKKSEKASSTVELRKLDKKGKYWFRFALKGLAIHADKYTSTKMYECAIDLLEKFFKGNPQRTVLELIPEAGKGDTFSVDDLIKVTMEVLTREVLECYFDKVGDDLYQVRASDSEVAK